MTMERIEGKNFTAGDVIFREGDRGDLAYVLVGGRVRITKQPKVDDGRELELAELTPFAIFGEMALYLEENTRTATATALEDTRVMVLERDNLEDFIRQSPKVLSKVIEDLSHRINDAMASRQPPSLAHSTAHVLAMLAANGHESAAIDSVVDMLAAMYAQTPDFVRSTLEQLAGQGHFALDAEAGLLRFSPDAGRSILTD